MHWLDFILILVLGIGGVLGLRSGLLWQVARLVIFFGAIYACIHFNADVAAELTRYFDGLNDTTSRLMAHLVIFLGVCLAGLLLTLILEHFLRAVHLKPLDRLLGAAVGVLKAGLIAGGILTGVALYASKDTRDSIAGSTVAPLLLEGMRYLVAAIPEETFSAAKDALRKALDGIREHGEKLNEGGPGRGEPRAP